MSMAMETTTHVRVRRERSKRPTMMHRFITNYEAGSYFYKALSGIDFESDYCEAVKAWRELYKDLSETIRAMKSTRREVPFGYVKHLSWLRNTASRYMYARMMAKDKYKASLNSVD